LSWSSLPGAASYAIVMTHADAATKPVDYGSLGTCRQHDPPVRLKERYRLSGGMLKGSCKVVQPAAVPAAGTAGVHPRTIGRIAATSSCWSWTNRLIFRLATCDQFLAARQSAAALSS
jgi:hypothetical protein